MPSAFTAQATYELIRQAWPSDGNLIDRGDREEWASGFGGWTCDPEDLFQASSTTSVCIVAVAAGS